MSLVSVQITLEIPGHETITLTKEQAEQLRDRLNEMFPAAGFVRPPIPWFSVSAVTQSTGDEPQHHTKYGIKPPNNRR